MAKLDSAESELKLSWWPSPQDYNEAIQGLRSNAQDPRLQGGLVHCTTLGIPRPLSGSFASVYKVHADGKDMAVRCFLRNINDQQERYAHISHFVQNDDLSYTLTFDFLPKGLRLNGRWFPILKMDWVEGLNLDLYIEQHIGTPKIALLADSFKAMCDDLRNAGIAHGDMQHGNIIVCNDELRLVDYDGMFVPRMAGMLSNEIGHRNYQHPGRTAKHFDANLDNFSAWVIYVSLRCTTIDPDLYRHLGGGDECLLFRRDDFLEPEHSYAFGLLEEHTSEEIRLLAKFLRWQLKRSLEDVPPLLDEIPPTPQLPALSIDLESKSDSPLSAKKASGGRLPDWVSPEELTETKVRALRQPRAVPARVVANRARAQYLPATIEPELQQPLPRFVKFNPNCGTNPYEYQALMLMNPLTWGMFLPLSSSYLWGPAIASFFINIFLEVWIWYKPLHHKELVRSGLVATTTYLKTSMHSGDEIVYYRVEFDFPASSNRIYKRISSEEFRRLEGQQSATVLFDPAYPTHNLLYTCSMYEAVQVVILRNVELELNTPLPRLVAYKEDIAEVRQLALSVLILAPLLGALHSGVLAFVAICATAFFEWLLWNKHLRERHLVSNGVPTNAKVTAAYLNQNSASGNIGSFIEYEFESYDGRIYAGKCRIKESELTNFAEGKSVTVLYDISSPQEKNMIYKLSRYRVKT